MGAGRVIQYTITAPLAVAVGSSGATVVQQQRRSRSHVVVDAVRHPVHQRREGRHHGVQACKGARGWDTVEMR